MNIGLNTNQQIASYNLICVIYDKANRGLREGRNHLVAFLHIHLGENFSIKYGFSVVFVQIIRPGIRTPCRSQLLLSIRFILLLAFLQSIREILISLIYIEVVFIVRSFHKHEDFIVRCRQLGIDCFHQVVKRCFIHRGEFIHRIFLNGLLHALRHVIVQTILLGYSNIHIQIIGSLGNIAGKLLDIGLVTQMTRHLDCQTHMLLVMKRILSLIRKTKHLIRNLIALFRSKSSFIDKILRIFHGRCNRLVRRYHLAFTRSGQKLISPLLTEFQLSVDDLHIGAILLHESLRVTDRLLVKANDKLFICVILLVLLILLLVANQIIGVLLFQALEFRLNRTKLGTILTGTNLVIRNRLQCKLHLISRIGSFGNKLTSLGIFWILSIRTCIIRICRNLRFGNLRFIAGKCTIFCNGFRRSQPNESPVRKFFVDGFVFLRQCFRVRIRTGFIENIVDRDIVLNQIGDIILILFNGLVPNLQEKIFHPDHRGRNKRTAFFQRHFKSSLRSCIVCFRE